MFHQWSPQGKVIELWRQIVCNYSPFVPAWPLLPLERALVMELARWFSSGPYCVSSLSPSSPHLYLYLPPVFSPVIRITLSSKLNKYTNTPHLSSSHFFFYLFFFLSFSPLLLYFTTCPFFCLFLLLSVWLRQLYASQPLTKGPFLFGSKYPLPPPPSYPTWPPPKDPEESVTCRIYRVELN